MNNLDLRRKAEPLRLLSGEYPVVTRSAQAIRREGKRRETKAVASGKRSACAV